MAKRFTATEKWIDPWFCGLSKDNKLFWIYLLDSCDHAGIWQVNWPLVKFYMGDYIFDKDIFNGRIVELTSEKWFIPKFITFQYGELNPENRAHLSVINILKKEGAYKGLIRGFQGATIKDKDKDKDNEKHDIIISKVVFNNDEYNNLIDIYGKTIIKEYIDRLNDYALSTPTKFIKYHNHAAVIRQWLRKDGIKKLPPKLEKPKESYIPPTPEDRAKLRSVVDKIGEI